MVRKWKWSMLAVFGGPLFMEPPKMKPRLC